VIQKAAMQRIRSLAQKYGNSFSVRAGVIFGGSALGQAIAFLMLPLIARIYDVDIVGRVATILAAVGILSLVVCLQYDQAIIVAVDADLPYLLLLSSLVAVIVCVLLLGGIVVLELSVSIPGGGHPLASLGANWTLPLLLLTYALFSLLTNLSLRRNKLSQVSTGRIIYYGGTSVLQVVSGYLFGPKESVFLLAQVVGSLVAVIYLLPYRSIPRFLAREPGVQATWSNMRRVGKTYVNFPKYQMGAAFANAVSVYLPVWFLRIAFSDAWAGWFYMAWRLLASPMTLVSQAIGQVFYRDSAERERDSIDQGRFLEDIVFGLLRVGLLPCVALGILAPYLVRAFLGAKWLPVSAIVQLLLVGMVVVFFTSPVSPFLNVKGRQAGALAYNLALLVLRTAALAIGWLLHSALGSVFAYSIATLVVFLPFVNYVLKSANGSFWTVLKRAMPLLLDTAVVMAIAILLGAMGWLYRPGGIAIVVVFLGVIAWRDLQRGGWRSAPAQPSPGTLV
jgi:O-antigen/teichoic acid export membrane protein